MSQARGGGLLLRVLIADNDLSLCRSLKTYLEESAGMEVVGIAPDGEQALTMIEAHEPDVVILDVTMPHLDGLGVLEKLDTLQIQRRPRIIVLTAFGREDIVRRFTEMNVDYFIVKPFDMEVLAERICQFAGDDSGKSRTSTESGRSTSVVAERHTGTRRTQRDYEAAVTALLHKIGIPAHFKGYNYLRDAVLMLLQDESLVGGSLTKELYPRLAERYNTTPGGVEAAIRNAVIAAWEHGNREFLNELTGSASKGKFPTNSLIIAKLADQMRYQLMVG